jgi:hypothetical protein
MTVLNPYIHLLNLRDEVYQQLYPDNNVSGHESVLSRYHDILNDFGEDDGSIMLQEHWFVYYLFTQQWLKAFECARRKRAYMLQAKQLEPPVVIKNEELLLNDSRVILLMHILSMRESDSRN